MTRAFAGAAALLLALTASAGEVVGDTYISEKDGLFEISAPGWVIADTEKKPPFQHHIAKFTVKNPLSGATPGVDLFRLANPGGQVAPEAMLGEIGKGLAASPGFTVKAMEERQLGGRRVHALPVEVVHSGVRVNGMIYMMKGEKSLYWAQFFAAANIWDQALPMFNRLMETAKY